MGKLSPMAFKNAVEPGRYQDGDGLFLLVKSKTSRSWMYRAQVDGKRRDFGLGSANDVGLAAARVKADEIRKQFKSGIDPVEAKKAAKRAQVEIPTFRKAAKLVHDEHKPGWKNDKHVAQWLSSLEAYAFPTIGDIRIDLVDAAAIRDLLLPIWLEKPETARRVRQRIAAVLDWGHWKGYRAAEAPTRSINKGLPRQPKKDGHFAALPYFDAPELMTALAANDSVGRLALQFTILTAARSGEVRGATWEEIEGDVWTIPANRMKAGKAHMVPLGARALAILETAKAFRGTKKGEPVFPGLKRQPLSDMTLAKALRSVDEGKATVHGFRSTFRDWAAEMTATPGDVVEAALAHMIGNRVEAAYRRTNYLDKRRILMDQWAAYLAGKSNVVMLAASN